VTYVWSLGHRHGVSIVVSAAAVPLPVALRGVSPAVGIPTNHTNQQIDVID
jgi:hypothetical protein